MKTSLTLSLALAVLTFALPASAATVRWNLLNVAFDDGGTASGYFIMDTDRANHVLPDFDVFVAGGTFSDLHYSSANAWNTSSQNRTGVVLWGPVGTTRVLSIATSVFLDLNTGTYAVTSGYECSNCFPLRRITSGFLTTADVATPEPGTLALLLLGGSALFARRIAANKGRRQ